MTFALIGVLAFCAAFALDYADTRHKMAVERRSGHHAGLWSIAMRLVGVFGTYALIEVSWWLVLPECAGLYIGSRVALRKHEPVGQSSGF